MLIITKYWQQTQQLINDEQFINNYLKSLDILQNLKTSKILCQHFKTDLVDVRLRLVPAIKRLKPNNYPNFNAGLSSNKLSCCYTQVLRLQTFKFLISV